MTRSNRFLMLSALLGACAPAPSQIDESQAALAVSGDFDVATMKWGAGYDSMTGNAAGTVCVDMTGVPDPAPITGAAGQITTFSMEIVEDKKQLEEKMSVAVSAKVNAALGSGSAKVNWSQERKFNSYSLYALVRTKVVNSTLHVDPTRLKPFYLDLYQTNPTEFRRRCGDLFVGGITTGGEFLSVLEIETKDASDKQSLSAKIKASATSGAWSARASFEQTIQTIQSTNRVQISSFQFGGKGTGQTPPTELQKILDRAQEMPTLVQAGDARAIEGTFLTYDTLEVPVVTQEDLTQQRLYLQLLLRRMDENTVRAEDREFVLRHPEQFAAFDTAQLTNDRDALYAQNVTVVGMASKCTKSFSECDATKNPLPALLAGNPPRRLTSAEIGVDGIVKGAASSLHEHAATAARFAQKVLEIEQTVGCGPPGQTLVTSMKTQRNDIATEASKGAIDYQTVKTQANVLTDPTALVAQAEQDQAAFAELLKQVDAAIGRAQPVADAPYVVYQSKADPSCPGEPVYKEEPNRLCGKDHDLPGTDANICGLVDGPRYQKSVVSCGFATAPACNAGDVDLGAFSTDTGIGCGQIPGTGRATPSRISMKYARNCMKRVPGTCVSEAFGTVWKPCAAPGNTIVSYPVCSSSSFGVDHYLACYKP